MKYKWGNHNTYIDTTTKYKESEGYSFIFVTADERGNTKFEPIDGTWSELSSYGTGPMRFASGIAVRQRSASVP